MSYSGSHKRMHRPGLRELHGEGRRQIYVRFRSHIIIPIIISDS